MAPRQGIPVEVSPTYGSWTNKRVDLTCEKWVKRGIEPRTCGNGGGCKKHGDSKAKIEQQPQKSFTMIIHYYPLFTITQESFTIHLHSPFIFFGGALSMASFEADGPWHLMTMLSPDIIFFQLCMGILWGSKIQTASKPILALYIPIFLDFRVAAIPSRIGLQHHSPQESAENSSSMVYGCSASLLPTAESGEGLTCSNHPESRTELLETMARAMKYRRVQWIFVLWIQGLKVWDPLKKARHPNAAKCKLMPRVPFARGTTRWGPLDS